MFLYHYYGSKTGAFRNLSDLLIDEANRVLDRIRDNKPNTQCVKRQAAKIPIYRGLNSLDILNSGKRAPFKYSRTFNVKSEGYEFRIKTTRNCI